MKLAICVGAMGLLMGFGTFANAGEPSYAERVQRCKFIKSDAASAKCYRDAMKSRVELPDDLSAEEVEEVSIKATSEGIRNSPEFAAKVRRCMALKNDFATVACLKRK